MSSNFKVNKSLLYVFLVICSMSLSDLLWSCVVFHDLVWPFIVLQDLFWFFKAVLPIQPFLPTVRLFNSCKKKFSPRFDVIKVNLACLARARAQMRAAFRYFISLNFLVLWIELCRSRCSVQYFSQYFVSMHTLVQCYPQE